MSKVIIIFVVVALAGIGAVIAINKYEEAKEKEATEQAAEKASEQTANDVIKRYDTALVRESARAIGNNVRPDDVQLQNVDRGISLVTWDAVTPEGAYNCHADDLLRKVLCVKKHK
jgi:cellobiose-specific phosphotransferase system component IIB